MKHILNAVLDFVNPSRTSDALYQEVLSNLKRAAKPRRSVNDLYSEFEAKIAEANARLGV